jgi:NADH dehydrogenase
VICGAGFGGLWAARRLVGEPVDVLLLDRNNYHTFFPLLYQVAAAELAPGDIAYPVRSILRKAPNVRFRMAEVCGLDLPGRSVITRSDRIPYDHLVLALGSVPNFFGVEGAAEHAFPLREMDHSLPLRSQILTCFESASHDPDPERRRQRLTFVIVGGGPTGVEYAGALAELVYGPLRIDYPDLCAEDASVILLEAMEGLLGGMSETLGAYAVRRLRSMGVEVRTSAKVTRIAPDQIELDGGESIPTETVVWTAGIQGDPRLRGWGLPVTRGGRVAVAPPLHLVDHPEVWIAGDLAWVEQDGVPLPQVAPVAMQQGEAIADNVLRCARGEEPKPFRYEDPGMLAVIGRNAAVADLGGRRFTGFLAWVLWLLIHIAKLIGFRNRALVLVNWAWNYLRYERAVRLILPPGPTAAVVEELRDSPGERDKNPADQVRAG